MKLRALTAGLLLPAMVLTACASKDDPQSATTTSVTAPATLPTLPPVVHPKAQVPRDRELAGVFQGLAALDACALLAAGKAKVRGFGTAKLHRIAPHRCQIEAKTALERTVVITAWPGAWNPWHNRFDMATTSLGGITAYRQPTEKMCRVWVPVSFDYSVLFDARVSWTEQADACRETDAFAAAAILVLAKATAPARVPHSGWSGCAALSAVLGRPIGALQPGDSVDQCSGGGADLSFWYGPAPKPDPGDKLIRIAGREVWLTQKQGCAANWSEGPSGQPAPDENHFRVTVRAANCGTTRTLTQKVRTLLAGPVRPSAPARYPLYLRADEPHSDRPGACADLWDEVGNQHCQPYVPVDAPKGGQEVLRGVRADANVACAISVAAVRKFLGAGLRPTTTLQENPPGQLGACTYVEQTHALTVTVGLSDETRLPAEPVSTPSKIAGRDALISTTVDGEQTRVQVTGADGAFLQLTFANAPARGSNVLDISRNKQLQPIAEEITGQYF